MYQSFLHCFLSHLNEENAERDCADEMMESRLFSVSSSHLGSTCLSDDASLPSATAAELVLAIASELAANLVWISARGDSRKWQTHADGSRNVSTTTSPESSGTRLFEEDLLLLLKRIIPFRKERKKMPQSMFSPRFSRFLRMESVGKSKSGGRLVKPLGNSQHFPPGKFLENRRPNGHGSHNSSKLPPICQAELDWKSPDNTLARSLTRLVQREKFLGLEDLAADRSPLAGR